MCPLTRAPTRRAIYLTGALYLMCSWGMNAHLPRWLGSVASSQSMTYAPFFLSFSLPLVLSPSPPLLYAGLPPWLLQLSQTASRERRQAYTIQLSRQQKPEETHTGPKGSRRDMEREHRAETDCIRFGRTVTGWDMGERWTTARMGHQQGSEWGEGAGAVGSSYGNQA